MISMDTEATQTIEKSRKDAPSLKESKLPNKIPEAIKNEEDLKNAYNLALQFWNEHFDVHELQAKLKEYLLLLDIELDQNEDLRKYFKTTRKAGLIFRSARYFFHKNLLMPEAFNVFLKQMGQLNDSFFISKEKGSKKASLVLNVLSIVDSTNLDFIPATMEEYHERVQAIVEKAKNFLNQDELFVPDFHTLRKDLRHIMNIYQLAAANNIENSDILQTFHFLLSLNSALGDVHDDFVKKKIAEDIDYDSTRMVIPDDLKNRLQDFYDELSELNNRGLKT